MLGPIVHIHPSPKTKLLENAPQIGFGLVNVQLTDQTLEKAVSG